MSPVNSRGVFGNVVSMLVAVKMEDGRVFWIGGTSRDAEFTFRRDPRDDMAEWLRPSAEWLGPPEPPSVEVRAIIEDYTGEWREGVPDVPKALGAGDAALEAPSVPVLPSAPPAAG